MLTYEAFCSECETLVALSQRAARVDSSIAEWQWCHGTRPHLTGNAFLMSTANAREWCVAATDSSDAVHSVSLEKAGVLVIDDLAGDINDLLAQHESDEAVVPRAALNDASATSTETVLCEFHIVYHVIYQTPVLYFRAVRLNGSPFCIDAHVRGLELPGSRPAAAVVSMEEHPVLGTPFWFMHPCETGAAMALLLAHNETRTVSRSRHEEAPSYLLAWLSLVAPVTQISALELGRLVVETQGSSRAVE